MHYVIFVAIGAFTGFLMALFGIGGGAFIVPAIDSAFLSVPALEHPPFPLIVMGSLCTIFIGSFPRAVAALRKAGRQRSVALTLILSAMPFIAISSVAATQLGDRTLRLGFALTIGLIGAWTMFGRAAATPSHSASSKLQKSKLVAVGAISGISSALFGLGGATLLMPLLTMWVGISITECIDISILFVATTSLVTLASLIAAWFATHGGSGGINEIEILLIVILGIVAAISQALAHRHLKKMNDAMRQRLLGIYLLALCGWVAYRTLV